MKHYLGNALASLVLMNLLLSAQAAPLFRSAVDVQIESQVPGISTSPAGITTSPKELLFSPATSAPPAVDGGKTDTSTNATTQVKPDAASTSKTESTAAPKANLQGHVRKGEEEAHLNVTYPDKYPFPLVSIQFPSDYSDTFVAEVSQMKGLRREKKDIVGALVDEQVIKSTYLACQLYDYLKTRLPEKTVVLVPCRLQTDGNGRVVNFPVNKPVPAVIQIDMSSWISIIRLKNPKMSVKLPEDTFGAKASTYVSMSMPINGKRGLFVGQPVLTPETGKIGQDIEYVYNTEFNGGKTKSLKTVSALPLSRKEQFTEGNFMVVRRDFRYSTKALDMEAKDTAKPLVPAATSQLRYYGNMITEALNRQDLEKIKPVLLSEYVNDIAPELSQSLAKSESGTPDLQRKEKFFNFCLNAMREQLFTKESDSVVDVVYAGDFGKQFRTSVDSEWQYEKKTMASQRRLALAMALCAATGGAGLAAMAVAAPIAALDMAVAASAVAVAGHEAQLQKKLHSTFKKSWGNSHAAQVSCLMMLDNDTIEVRGDGAEEFRKNMKEAYEKRFGPTATGTM